MQYAQLLRGPIAPVFTIFKEDLTLDDAGQCAFLDFLLESGAINAYFVRSGMGQMATFSYEEVKQIARNACSHLDGKAPVLVNATGIWDRDRSRLPDPEQFVREAVELSQYAESVGAAGVVSTLPEAIPPRGGESHADVSVRYFEAMCDAVSIPVMIYQPPDTASEYQLTPDLAARLADIPNLNGVKASTADAAFMFDIIWATRGKDFAYIVGAEMGYYAGLALGAKGVLGQGTTLNPQIIQAVEDNYYRGETDAAMEAQYWVNHLVYSCKNPVRFFKEYAAEKGYPVGTWSRPMAANPYANTRQELTKEDYDTFKQLYEETIARYSSLSTAKR